MGTVGLAVLTSGSAVSAALAAPAAAVSTPEQHRSASGDEAHVRVYRQPAPLPLPQVDGLPETLSRPYLPAFPLRIDRHTPPPSAVNLDLSTFDAAVQSWDPNTSSYRSAGNGVNRVQPTSTFSFLVEQAVVGTHGMAALTSAIEQLNRSPGSRFRATIAGTVSDGVRAPAQDGVWRIFFDDATCRSGDLAWAHLQAAEYDAVYGGRQIAVGELDLGLCRGLSASDLHATIGHELLHGTGMSHLCNLGERCFKPGMSADNTCRIMYPSARTCQVFGERDARALAYLHPTVPRLSGPTRFETAARADFSLRRRGTATQVVFVDGEANPDLAIQAAAFAAAIDAPLLLTSANRPCTKGPTAAELNRVATSEATVWLVGPMPPLCSVDLLLWGIRTRVLANGAAVADAIVSQTGGAGTAHTILVTRGAINGDTPDALAAAAVAGRLRGPVLYARGSQLTAESQQWLEQQRGTTTRAIVVGGLRAVPDQVVLQLRRHGLDVVRLSGPTRIDTALALARHNPAFGTTRTKVLIAAADRWPDTVTASAVGGARGWPVVLVNRDSVPGAVTTYLLNTRAAAVIVGGPGVVSDATQYALSRTVRTLP